MLLFHLLLTDAALCSPARNRKSLQMVQNSAAAGVFFFFFKLRAQIISMYCKIYGQFLKFDQFHIIKW